MPEAIFDIRKDQSVLCSYRLPNLEVNKQSVEAAVLKICGLKSDQYQVYYLDSQNDLIMATVDQDYSIAEQTFQDDVIQFKIEIKVGETELVFSNEFRQKEEQQSDLQSQKDGSSSEMQDVSCSNHIRKSCQLDQTQPKQDQKVEDNCQEKNQKKEERNAPTQPIDRFSLMDVQQIVDNSKAVSSQPSQKIEQQRQQQVCQAQVDIKQQQGGPSEQSQPVENSDTNKSEKLVSSMSQKLLDINQQIAVPMSQLDNNQNTQRIPVQAQPLCPPISNRKQDLVQKIFTDPKLMDQLFNRVCMRLPEILKSECFKIPPKTLQAQSILVCFKCSKLVQRLPYYITQQNLIVCERCEQTLEEDYILVKVRSQKKMKQLIGVKIIPVFNDDIPKFSQMEADLVIMKDNYRLLQKLVNEIAIKKIGLEMQSNDSE